MNTKHYFYGFFGTALMTLALVLIPTHAQGQAKTSSLQGHALSYSVTGSGDPDAYGCLSLIKEKKEANVIKEIWVKVPRNEPNSASLCDALKSGYTHKLELTIQYTSVQKDKSVIPIRIDYPQHK